MGLSRRTFPVGALSTSALAATGCAGTVARPGGLVPSPFSLVVLLVVVLLGVVLAVVGPPVVRRCRSRTAVAA